ncbi:MAG: DUF3144 domain-containing protein [Sedimentisphaerales bacterium]
MEKPDEKMMYNYADQFINLANEISKSDKSGSVGMAIRFAAARFSIYEVSTQSNDLAGAKDKYLQLLAEDFKKMLEFNIDDYIRLLSSK